MAVTDRKSSLIDLVEQNKLGGKEGDWGDWGERGDLNPQPPAPQAGALTS